MNSKNQSKKKSKKRNKFCKKIYNKKLLNKINERKKTNVNYTNT